MDERRSLPHHGMQAMRRSRPRRGSQMKPPGRAVDFVTSMFERRADPVRGSRLEFRASDRDRAILGLSALLSLAFLPLEPVDEQIGGAGWAVAGVLIAAGLVGAVVARSRRADLRTSCSSMAYLGVAGIATLNWLAGGGSSAYEDLFVLWMAAGAVQPPRRADRAPGRAAARAGAAARLPGNRRRRDRRHDRRVADPDRARGDPDLVHLLRPAPAPRAAERRRGGAPAGPGRLADRVSGTGAPSTRRSRSRSPAQRGTTSRSASGSSTSTTCDASTTAGAISRAIAACARSRSPSSAHCAAATAASAGAATSSSSLLPGSDLAAADDVMSRMAANVSADCSAPDGTQHRR